MLVNTFRVQMENIFVDNETRIVFQWRMTLSEYITMLGDQTAAQVLGISERAAKSYRLGKRTPRPAKAQNMVKRSKGKLTLETIYGR